MNIIVLLIRRVWPAPRWPLIHEAKKIYINGGEEALIAWVDSLSDEDKIEAARQICDLISAGAERVEKEIETCPHCKGTGRRSKMFPRVYCWYCDGTGKRKESE